MKKKPKIYAVDPVTGRKLIVYDYSIKRRIRWDENEPNGIIIELPCDWVCTDDIENGNGSSDQESVN